jgi:hypothetical protein
MHVMSAALSDSLSAVDQVRRLGDDGAGRIPDLGRVAQGEAEVKIRWSGVGQDPAFVANGLGHKQDGKSEGRLAATCES